MSPITSRLKRVLLSSLFATLLPLQAMAFNPSPPPADPTPPPTGSLPPVSRVDVDGPYAVTVERSTGPSRSGWVVRPRTLGANNEKHPIFIWGPGAGTGPSNYEFHLRRIASHGFVVYSQTSTSGGREMTSAMDWLISQNGSSRSAYHNKLDIDRIAVGGHSRGSLASFSVASDPRLTTSIHVAGGSFDGNGSRNLRNPTAYICAENDASATSNCRRDYAATRVPVWFTVMDGSSHTSAARDGLPMIVAWLRWHLAGEIQRREMFIGSDCEFCGSGYETQHKNW